jgi:hypothetical protein
MEIPKLKIFDRKTPPENSNRPDNIISKKQCLQSAVKPANEHRRAEIDGKAKREIKTTEDGSRIEMLVSEDGSILEYVNQTGETKAKQQKLREDIADQQEKILRDKLSQN